MCALVLACVLAGVALEPADDVRARLDKAIAAHRMAMDKACNDIDDALSSKIELLYIINETSELEKCRCGLLPKNLDIMLNNHQTLFLRNQTQLMDNIV